MLLVEALGSGGYHPTEKRQTACYLVNHNIVLDAGSGILKLANRLPPVLHVLLSHIHIDHSCGLAYLYGFRGNTKIKVYCSREEIEFLKTNFFSSRLFDPSSDFIEFIELGDEIEIEGRKIKVVPQTHGIFGSRGFIFGDEFAYFTDTVARLSLELSVKVLFHEAYSLYSPLSGHTSVSTLAQLVAAADVGSVWIIHINPEWSTLREQEAIDICDRVLGRNRFRLVEDGMMVKI